MAKSRRLLNLNRSYHFLIFYGVDPNTISKLNIGTFGIMGVRTDSTDFENIISEITELDYMIKKDIAIFRYFRAEVTSYLFYSESKANIHKLYYFLSFLRPSKISWWLEFEGQHRKINIDGKKRKEHYAGGSYSIWTDISRLYQNLNTEEIFYLTDNDCKVVNKIIPKFNLLSKRELFQKSFVLYTRAYQEEDTYFKYLLLFMTIESLIIDDDITGVNYKVRRLCAVLVGTDAEICEIIYKHVSSAYNIRSKFVHSGKTELEKTNYLHFIHSIVCELMILMLIGETETKNLFKLSTTLGFGQRNQLIKNKSFVKVGNLEVNLENLTRKMK